uniref:Uncharacterized protein n=1 Tax=Panagrellus redivivus TaxID=6233 RepID=A0A7E4V4V8_PANRE
MQARKACGEMTSSRWRKRVDQGMGFVSSGFVAEDRQGTVKRLAACCGMVHANHSVFLNSSTLVTFNFLNVQ